VKISLHKQMFALAIPMILSNITVPLLGLVDTAVVGHLDHAYFLGGSTVGATVITFVVWLCGFLRMSTTGLAAQANGQRNDEQGLLVLVRGLLVALFIGLSVIAFQDFYITFALQLAGGSEQVQLYASQYSEIRVWGLPASLANLVILGWLLGCHQPKSVMWILIITNVTNLCLDLLFVIYFDWQVEGVAYASLIAEYAGLLLGLTFIFTQIKQLLPKLLNRLSEQLFENKALLSYFKLNRDIVIRTLCLQICFIFITFQGARLGDNVVAANAILMNFLLFISFGLDGIANAVEVMVGKAKGKQQQRMLKQVVKIGAFWTLIFAVSYCLLFVALGKQFIQLITDIESVREFTYQYLPWIVLLPVVACWSFLFDGIYIGLTQGKAMRNSMMISTFLCFFPFWWLFQNLGNHGIWLAFTLFMLARGITLSMHFKNNFKSIQSVS